MARPLQQVRYSERTDFKRCQKKWYWRWRKGLKLKRPKPSALDLGTWLHYGFERWYGKGFKRVGTLREWVTEAWMEALELGVPDAHMDKFEELTMLVEAMADAYEKHYKRDENIKVLGIEVPLEFSFMRAVHRLKPDMVIQLRNSGLFYLFEHKSAGQVLTEHLTIDDQARGYAAMAERGLLDAGVLPKGAKLSGILYNIVRKALPDDREQNEQGEYLNKDGSVSKRQPGPQFFRVPLAMSTKAKAIALRRIDNEVNDIVNLTVRLRAGETDPLWIRKTPHRSCPRFCDFFPVCSAEEQGSDIRQMLDDMYVIADPYAYDQDSTSDPISWEM
jgi:hypothetical protein